VQPQLLWIIPRAFSMAVVSAHLALMQSAKAGGTGTRSTSMARAAAKTRFMDGSSLESRQMATGHGLPTLLV
jgi:Xaa-Pro aminopeptidase